LFVIEKLLTDFSKKGSGRRVPGHSRHQGGLDGSIRRIPADRFIPYPHCGGGTHFFFSWYCRFITGAYLGIPLMTIFLKISDGMDVFALLAIPFFILAGSIMAQGGIAGALSSSPICWWAGCGAVFRR
jgi:hypothetical protein